jgi:hypothetical protein
MFVARLLLSLPRVARLAMTEVVTGIDVSVGTTMLSSAVSSSCVVGGTHPHGAGVGVGGGGPAGGEVRIRLRLQAATLESHQIPFVSFDDVIATRKREADEFYADLQKDQSDDDARLVQRQAFAGMIWNKQFFYYDVREWLRGDPAQPAPPAARRHGRNSEWTHVNNADIISMPDKWEYPWYAAWDLAFHCISELVGRAWAVRGLSDFWQHCLVAEGALDIATDPIVNLWDFAAVRLIVEEAGGRCTTFENGVPSHGGSLLSTNDALHGEACALLATAQAAPETTASS